MVQKYVVLDCDDTTFHFVPHFCTWHNRKYGTSVQPSDIRSYAWSEAFDCSHAHILARLHEFSEADAHTELQPVAGMRRMIEVMRASGLRVVMATNRSPHAQPYVLPLYEQYFAGCFDTYHFLGNSIYGGGKSKIQLCREIGAIGLVDDAPQHVRGAYRYNIRAFMPEQWWNKHENPEQVTRLVGATESEYWAPVLEWAMNLEQCV